MRKLVIGIVAVCLWGGAARAEVSSEAISAYNKASQNGSSETRIAAAKALATEAIANPEDETSALLAYEAAWTMCRLGECEAAQAAADYALSQPALDPAAHPIAADRELLASFAAWKTKQSGRSRARLDDALDGVFDADPSLLSLSAFLSRYTSDVQRERFRAAKVTAAQAATHFEPVKDQVPQYYFGAKISALTSSFYVQQSSEDQIQMAHLQGQLQQLYHAASEGDNEAPDWLKNFHYGADAWSLTMKAYFASANKTGASEAELDEILASYEVDEASNNAVAHAADAEEEIPFCKGSLNMTPAMRYPSGNARRGMFGSVIIGFDLEDGQVKNAEVLASVPFEGFREKALETLNEWTWEADEDQPAEPCNATRSKIVQPFVFALD